jgi:uncharacterized protein YuzE
MAETEIESVLKALRHLPGRAMKDMHVRYDEVADTLYVNFGAPIAADDSELTDNDVLYRFREGEIIGVTVTHFSKR